MIAKLIERHSQLVGGVQAKWLAQEAGVDLSQVEDRLAAQNYQPTVGHWFLPTDPKTLKDTVLYSLVGKLLYYNGPLTLDNICRGVRQVVGRLGFPSPPPDVMAHILQAVGCQTQAGNYVWAADLPEALSSGEVVLLDHLEQNGPVAHYSALARAFIAAELPFGSLRSTLECSPLFERVAVGLYKQRGKGVSGVEIARAKRAASRTPVDLDVQYDKRGKIVVGANLGVQALGAGVISSAQLPNLSGEWDCFAQGEFFGKLVAGTNVLRQLQAPFRSLGCRVGDRVELVFDTWERSVHIEKREG